MTTRAHIAARTTDLETALRTTGAVRAFTDHPVTRADVTRILDVARFAPSGANQQAWHVVSVESPAVRMKLGELIMESAREYVALAQAGVRPFSLSEHGRWPGPGDVDLAAARAAPVSLPEFEGLAHAPGVLAVLVELGRLAHRARRRDDHIRDPARTGGPRTVRRARRLGPRRGHRPGRTAAPAPEADSEPGRGVRHRRHLRRADSRRAVLVSPAPSSSPARVRPSSSPISASPATSVITCG